MLRSSIGFVESAVYLYFTGWNKVRNDFVVASTHHGARLSPDEGSSWYLHSA